ncbi:GABA transporter 1 [Vitis vinifera]|uniref:GABA transporter 1 n=1 Tax=Vitis vinifera TaxID=29760 RepID=A0A438CRL3_VITVI|nr:GABA transporter 1 [Vitis vinifera]
MEAGLSHSMKMAPTPPKPLDAGALFVLKSKGKLHESMIIYFQLSVCCLSIMVALRLPSYHIDSVSGDSESSLWRCRCWGGVGGVFFLTMTALVTFYSYNLLSVVLEHHAQLGPAPASFPGHGYRYFRRVTSCLVLPNTSFIYLLSRPNGTMQLYQFVINFGSSNAGLSANTILPLLKAHKPCLLVLCLSFCASATAGSIYSAFEDCTSKELFCTWKRAELTDKYGSSSSWQATIAPPVKGKMFKGLCVCYAVVLTTFFSVAISGYWAFGNQAKGTVLGNFMVDEKALLPSWVLLMTNVFTLLQVSAVSLVYLQPTNEVLEQKFADPKIDHSQFATSCRGWFSGHFQWSIATTLAAMLPFFGDINAVLGAFGFIPLDSFCP